MKLKTLKILDKILEDMPQAEINFYKPITKDDI